MCTTDVLVWACPYLFCDRKFFQSKSSTSSPPLFFDCSFWASWSIVQSDWVFVLFFSFFAVLSLIFCLYDLKFWI
jgi:hypothetical protein